MITSMHDVRYAARQLRKSPGFTVAAVLTLAVAIGANAVVFAALNALILRPLNVPHAQTLYSIGRAGDNFGYESFPNYEDLRDRNHSFDGLAASDFSQPGLDSGNGPNSSWGYKTTGNYFDVLGLQPHLGRFYHASDEHGPNSAPYMVLTYAFWQHHFQGDPNVIGRRVQLNKHPFTIIGVAPQGFVGTFQAFAPDFFAPIVNQEQIDGRSLLTERNNRWVSEMFGRLKPGVTPQQAVADLNAIGTDLVKQYPKDNHDLKFTTAHLGMADVFGGAMRAFMGALMLLALLILLAACANLGSLFTARAADRSREIAVRLALGSSRARVMRTLFTEALLLSFFGGALGLWVSVLLLRGLRNWQPFPEFPLNMPISPDVSVYVVAVILSIVSGIIFGAVPIRQVLRSDPYRVIKAGATESTGRRRLSVRDALIAIQIAICAVLVTSSLVAVRGLLRSLHANLGFDPHDVILARTDLSQAGYRSDAAPAVQKRMLEAVQAVPGVLAAGLVSSDPPLHMGWDERNVFREDTADLSPANTAGHGILYGISPDYLHAAGTALLVGRNFSDHDDTHSPNVAIVNELFARSLFGSPEQALGRAFKIRDGVPRRIVGVVQDGKYTANIAEEPRMAMFVPIAQFPGSVSWLVIRSARDQQELGADIRSAIHTVDPALPVFVQTWQKEMNGALFASRMAAISLGVLGIMGAMLSITGIFGMAAYSVARRMRELGIRLALGAQWKEVLQAALGPAFRLLAIGSATGFVLGLLASRVLSAIVYQASPRDPVVLAGAVIAMSLLGLLATSVPAQRALSLDPAVLLRDE